MNLPQDIELASSNKQRTKESVSIFEDQVLYAPINSAN
ncbi:hypothetical protein KIS4809_4291 [Bacillus sp. ZZV12-4809]|nr:hypothetical protein KIS4809_4291 [Bacillus sp. ZZV12-4809]